LLTIGAVLTGAAYLFDPPAYSLNPVSGQVLSVLMTEHPKSGFRQILVVRLASGEVVQLPLPSGQLKGVMAGATVTVNEFRSLLFHKRSFRAEQIELRPNNSFKPKPLRGSA
jgi:hypothetical protein